MRVSRLFFCRFAGIRLAGRIKYGREDKKWIKKSLVFSFPIESGDEGRSQVEKLFQSRFLIGFSRPSVPPRQSEHSKSRTRLLIGCDWPADQSDRRGPCHGHPWPVIGCW